MKSGILMLILILPCIVWGTVLSIEIKDRVWINDPVVTVEDITDSFQGPDSLYRQISDIEICNLPYRERFRNLYHADIIKLVPSDLRKRVKIEGAFCVVRWAKQSIDQNQVYKAAREYISKSYPDADSIYLEIGELPELDTPSQDYSIQVEFPDGVPKMGNVRMIGTILYRNQPQGRFSFTTYIGVFRKAYQLTKTKRRGEGFRLGDTVRITLNCAEEASAITDSLSLQSRIASRYLPRGTVLTSRNTRLIPDINRGDRVSIVVNSGSIQLETVAIAKNTGYMGESITCEDPATGRRYQALATGKRQAMINLGE